MKFDLLTIFPHCLDSYFNESILKRAVNKKIISIQTHDIREYTLDKHKKVDAKPYGGGPGMILQIEPIYRCLSAVKKLKKHQVILLDPAGVQFTQKLAQKLAKEDQLILIAGRYEGLDARLHKYIDQRISIGPYTLAGGELGAGVIIEAVGRLLPGVLGSEESLTNESFSGANQEQTDFPQYSRPEVFNKQRVPKILLSGDHQKIAKWRNGKRRIIK